MGEPRTGSIRGREGQYSTLAVPSGHLLTLSLSLLTCRVENMLITTHNDVKIEKCIWKAHSPGSHALVLDDFVIIAKGLMIGAYVSDLLSFLRSL